MKIFIKSIKVTILILTISACAEQARVEKKISNSINSEPTAKRDDVIEAAREYISKSPNLTESQKLKLISIEEKAVLETGQLIEEINKARMVLIKSAFDPSYNAREVETVKNKILMLERKKIRLGLNSFTEARNVIDPKQLQQTKALNKVFLNEHFPRM